MQRWKRIGQILLNIIIPLVGIILFCLWGPKLLGFFAPFVVGAVIALIANPLVKLLVKLRLGRKHSSALTIVVVLGLVVFGGYALLAMIFRELAGLIAYVPEVLKDFQSDFASVGQNISQLLAALPAGVQEAISNATANLSSTVGSLVGKLGEPTIDLAGRVVGSLPKVLVGTVVAIVSSYFFLADRENIGIFLKKHLPKSWLQAIDVVRGNTRRIIGGYFSAQFKIMLVVAVVLYVGFLILRVKYAFGLALLIALLDFLPVFGTGTVLIPWGIFEALSGDFAMTAGLAVIYVASQGFHQAVQPKMVGDSMKMNPLYVLFLLYLGFKFYGIGGMIIAVPIGLIVEDLYKAGMFDNLLKNLRLLWAEINSLRGLTPEGNAEAEETKEDSEETKA